MMRLAEAMIWLGAVSVVTGCFLIDITVGLIVGGLAAIAIGILTALR